MYSIAQAGLELNPPSPVPFSPLVPLLSLAPGAVRITRLAGRGVKGYVCVCVCKIHVNHNTHIYTYTYMIFLFFKLWCVLLRAGAWNPEVLDFSGAAVIGSCKLP